VEAGGAASPGAGTNVSAGTSTSIGPGASASAATASKAVRIHARVRSKFRSKFRSNVRSKTIVFMRRFHPLGRGFDRQQCQQFPPNRRGLRCRKRLRGRQERLTNLQGKAQRRRQYG